MELRRKALATPNFYRSENRDTFSTESWPRDAEVELIEALVLKKAQQVTGKAEIPESLSSFKPAQTLAIPSDRKAALKTRDIPTPTHPHLRLNNNGCKPPLRHVNKNLPLLLENLESSAA